MSTATETQSGDSKSKPDSQTASKTDAEGKDPTAEETEQLKVANETLKKDLDRAVVRIVISSVYCCKTRDHHLNIRLKLE